MKERRDNDYLKVSVWATDRWVVINLDGKTGRNEFKEIGQDVLNWRCPSSGDSSWIYSLAFRIEIWAREVGRGQHMAIFKPRRLDEVTKRVSIDRKNSTCWVIGHSNILGQQGEEGPSKGDWGVDSQAGCKLRGHSVLEAKLRKCFKQGGDPVVKCCLCVLIRY